VYEGGDSKRVMKWANWQRGGVKQNKGEKGFFKWNVGLLILRWKAA
jgi:hypothetical protein